jgi:PTH1 family peptidyl-tRNA hydrolase
MAWTGVRSTENAAAKPEALRVDATFGRMKLVVGLGNPGRRYQGTRHNIGFEVVTELVRRHAVDGRPKVKFDGELIEANVDGQTVCLAYPLTYMNESGRCVRQVVDFYKIPASNVLVVCDDFNLPLAKLRFRPNGSHGGQNGLEDILQRLGTLAVPRLRIGIGPLPPQWDAANFVLSRYGTEDRAIIDQCIPRAADAVRVWLAEGIAIAMNRYNGEPADPGGSAGTANPTST